MKTKLLIGTAVLAMSLSNAASAGEYTKSIVLDARANPVKTKDGVCVTHNFPEISHADCKAAEAPIVYFALGSSSLDAKGKRVVDTVAKAVKGTDNQVVLSGFTDRSASDSFNEKLSNKRVDAVKKALVARGVKADAISAKTFGETNNAVPTKDGVVEKLNRRVEIEIVR